MESILTPATTLAYPQQHRQAIVTWLATHRWMATTGLLAMISGSGAAWYVETHGWFLLYRDSHSHLDIARRVFDNTTPGIAQLGGVWLPLPHLVLLPFVWHDWLWQSGMAGMFASLPCFIITALLIHASIAQLTGEGPAATIGALAFITNPNMLYLQTTPLTEPLLMATLTATIYFLIRWAQEGTLYALIGGAGCLMLATLTRYDGWPVFLVTLVVVPIIGRLRGGSRGQICAETTVFALLGGMGIALWFLWCAIIFHDPLYWQHGPYAAQSQTAPFIAAGVVPSYHHIERAWSDYVTLTATIVGPLLTCTGLTGLAAVGWRWHKAVTWALMLTLVPAGFYILSFFTGQVFIYLPATAPATVFNPWFNDRYGVVMLLPVALGCGLLTRIWRPAMLIVPVIVIIQSIAIAMSGVATLNEGIFGMSCYSAPVIQSTLATYDTGGWIIDDRQRTNIDYDIPGIPLKRVLYEGAGPLWQQALHQQIVVDWIITEPRDDMGSDPIVAGQHFTGFTALAHDPKSGDVLFVRTALLTSLAPHSYPDYGHDYSRCNAGDPRWQRQR